MNRGHDRSLLHSLLIALLSVQSSLADSCGVYPGGYCTRYVSNQSIFLATGKTVETQEANLKAGGIDLLLSLNASVPANRPCVSAFVQWACYSSYPKCFQDAVQDVPCISLCRTVVTECTTLFTQFGKAKILPDCNGTIQSLNITYSNSSTCLGQPSGIPPPPTPPTNTTCKSILLKDPQLASSPNAKEISPYTHIEGQTCVGGCCLPCPSIYQFYTPTTMSNFNLGFQIAVFLSMLGAGFTLFSFLVFPHRREHPASMMLFFNIGSFILHAFQAFNVGGDGYRVGCLDEITEARQSNSPLCGIQGFVLAWAALYLTYWVTIFMFNLQLQLVWRKDWLKTRYLQLHLLSIVYSIGPPLTLVSLNGVESIGFTCLASVDHVVWVLLVPLGVVGWPGVVITVATVFYLCLSLMGRYDFGGGAPLSGPESIPSTTVSDVEQSVNSTHTTGDRKSSYTKERNSGYGKEQGSRTSEFTAASRVLRVKDRVKKHRDKLIAVLIKGWRSILICIAFVTVFGPFWFENLITANKLKGVDSSTPWVVAWFTCIMEGGSQAECYPLAQDHVSNVYAAVISQAHVTIGSFIFLVFGTGMIEDWRELCLKGKKRRGL